MYIYLLPLVVAFVIHFLGHSKVCHFDYSLVGQQNVSCRQIAVEYLYKDVFSLVG